VKTFLLILTFFFASQAFSGELNYFLVSCEGRMISLFRRHLEKINKSIPNNEGVYRFAQKASRLSYNLGLEMSNSELNLRFYNGIVWSGFFEFTPAALGLPESTEGCQVIPLITTHSMVGYENPLAPLGNREALIHAAPVDLSILSLLFSGMPERILRDLELGLADSMTTQQKAEYLETFSQAIPSVPSYSYFPPGLDSFAVELEDCSWWPNGFPKDCEVAPRPSLCQRYEKGQGYCESFYGKKIFLGSRDPISFWPNGRLKILKYMQGEADPREAGSKIRLPEDLQHPQTVRECGAGTIFYSEGGLLRNCPHPPSKTGTLRRR
jgi:hypothetical protein